MCPEYGATVGFFPVDDETLKYMRFTGRDDDLVEITEAYCKEQGLFRTDATPDPVYSEVLELDLGTIEPSLAGPKRPQDRIALGDAQTSARATIAEALAAGASPDAVHVADQVEYDLTNGAVVIAAITSCTNTSNPEVMVGAGLLAKKAAERGLRTKPWVKTSLAPGSKVVTRVPRRGRPHAVPRRARFQPRGLRLHDVHRQLRPAARRDRGGRAARAT